MREHLECLLLESAIAFGNRLLLGYCHRKIAPWWNYFLGVLKQAYLEFARQVESASSRPAKGDLVRQAVTSQVGPFTLADLSTQLPAVSAQLIKKVLAEMKKAGQMRLVGRSRGPYWENAGSPMKQTARQSPCHATEGVSGRKVDFCPAS